MLRQRYASRLIRALAFGLFATPAGRKCIAAVVAVAAVWGLVGSDAKRSGTWSGLANHIAPNEGSIELQGAPGESATCTVRGETKGASGDRWVFKGHAAVAETSCEGRIEKDGRVSAVLQLKMEWNGRIKGMGGDWEDIDGKCTCEGDLKGTLAAGGKWEAKCKNDKGEWETSFEWELDAD
jgi:hypothetical protein